MIKTPVRVVKHGTWHLKGPDDQLQYTVCSRLDAAEQIATALNFHDELVEALRMLEIASSDYRTNGSKRSKERLRSAGVVVRRLLAKLDEVNNA